jgi:hypothetical protein
MRGRDVVGSGEYAGLRFFKPCGVFKVHFTFSAPSFPISLGGAVV